MFRYETRDGVHFTVSLSVGKIRESRSRLLQVENYGQQSRICCVTLRFDPPFTTLVLLSFRLRYHFSRNYVFKNILVKGVDQNKVFLVLALACHAP